MELKGQAQLIDVFIHWNQTFTWLGLNLTARHDKYDTATLHVSLTFQAAYCNGIYKGLFS